MSNEALVLTYRESELRYRNAWARRRRRESLRYAIAALTMPFASLPLALVLSVLSEPATAPAKFFLQTADGAFAMCSAAATGIGLAVFTLAHAYDARIGRLPRHLGGIGLILNGCLLFLTLSALAYGVPWKILP